MTWCTICKKSFYDVSSLRGHVKKFHPDELDEIAPKKKKSVAASCVECGKSFSTYSNFIRHVKTFHSDKINDLRKSKEYTYECEECGKHFMHSKNFNYHKKNHGSEKTEGTSDESVKKVEKYKCCLCSEGNFEKSKILEHFKVVHDIQLSSLNLKFSNEEEFDCWKREVEKETRSKFIKKHGSYSTKNFKKIRFICHWSGTYNPEGSGMRKLKVQGTDKINGYCPAQIVLTVLNNGECEVEFVDSHVGHNQELGHIILSKSERETIAAKIAAKIPFQTILDEVREESLSQDKLERMHLLTRKDLYNIEQCYNLSSEAVRHVKDIESVEVSVKEVEDIGYALFYKPLTNDENSNFDSDQQIILEFPTIGEEKTENDLYSDKEKLKLKLNELIDSIESREELNTVENLFARVQQTLVTMRSEKDHTEFSNRIPCETPHNENVIQQRCLFKTKKVVSKQSSELIIPDEENIAIHFMYPPNT